MIISNEALAQTSALCAAARAAMGEAAPRVRYPDDMLLLCCNSTRGLKYVEATAARCPNTIAAAEIAILDRSRRLVQVNQTFAGAFINAASRSGVVFLLVQE